MFGISKRNAKIEEMELQLIQKQSILSAINKHVAYICLLYTSDAADE